MPCKDTQLKADKAYYDRDKEKRKNDPELDATIKARRAEQARNRRAAAATARAPHPQQQQPLLDGIASTNDSRAAADNHLHAVSSKDTLVLGVTNALDALALTLPPLASTTPNEMSLGTMEAFVTAFERAKEVMSQFAFSES